MNVMLFLPSSRRKSLEEVPDDVGHQVVEIVVFEVLVMTIFMNHPSQLLPGQAHEEGRGDIVTFILEEETHQNKSDTLEELADEKAGVSVQEAHFLHLVSKFIEVLRYSFRFFFRFVVSSQVDIIDTNK